MDKRMEVAKVSRNLLDHCMTDPKLRLKETDFTRQRKLGPQRLLRIMLDRLAACLQLAIDKYFIRGAISLPGKNPGFAMDLRAR